MIETFEELLGKKAVVEYLRTHSADIKETWANIGKANEFLNWTPKVQFKEGLSKLI